MRPRGDHPRIGVTTYYLEASWPGGWQREAAIVPDRYVHGVAASGGTPLLLPPVGTDTGVLEDLDGLVVIGGPDIDPAAYHAAAHPQTVPDPRRDVHEFALTRAALNLGVPLFAICRGAQVLNVALGGTLHQHLPDMFGHGRHRPGPAIFGSARVRTTAGSLISGILGEHADVPCYHHQAIDRIGADLVPTARSADGLVQAVELAPGSPYSGWVLGVQFHPEENPSDQRLFRAFTHAARQWAEPRGRTRDDEEDQS